MQAARRPAAAAGWLRNPFDSRSKSGHMARNDMISEKW